jgi:hypothetical protein
MSGLQPLQISIAPTVPSHEPLRKEDMVTPMSRASPAIATAQTRLAPLAFVSVPRWNAASVDDASHVQVTTEGQGHLDAIELRDVVLRGTGVVRRDEARASFSWDTSGRLISRTQNGEQTAFSYDAQGRLTKFGDITFSWNERDQLVATHVGDPTLDGRERPNHARRLRRWPGATSPPTVRRAPKTCAPAA